MDNIMVCEKNENNTHDFDELGECCMCGKNKLELCYKQLYQIIKRYDLSEDEKGAISFIITYSNDLGQLVKLRNDTLPNKSD